jgi:hypothetical protein
MSLYEAKGKEQDGEKQGMGEAEGDERGKL